MVGYRVIDLNYPTLSALISALNRHGMHMTLIQCCASDAQDYIEQLHDPFPALHDEFIAEAHGFDNILHIHEAMQRLSVILDKHCSNITALYNDFTDAKVSYW